MIQAQLDDGRVLEFPDGTKPEVVQATVKRLLAQSTTESTSQSANTESSTKQVTQNPDGSFDTSALDDDPRFPIAASAREPSREEKQAAKKQELIDQGLSELEADLEVRQEFSPIQGAIDAGVSLAKSTITSPIGFIGGALEGFLKEFASGNFGTHEAAQRIEELSAQRAREFSFQPETEAGREQLANIGQALEPLSALPPFVPGGQAATTLTPQALRQANNATRRAVAPIAEAAARRPDFDDRTPNQRVIDERVTSGDADVELLGKSSVDGRTVKTEGVRRAQAQGWSDPALRSVETANPTTKKALDQMLGILKKRRKNADFAARNRVTDVVGKSVNARYQALQRKKKELGERVNQEAEALKGADYDLGRETETFFGELESFGVRVSEKNGKLTADYSRVDSPDIRGTKKAVGSILNRINELNDSGLSSAFEAHKMKRLITESVDFNALPTTESKLASGVENAFKKFRKNISDDLNSQFEGYGEANRRFSEVIQPLGDLDRAFKTILNTSSGDALSSGLGTRAARTIMSNNAGRAAMLDLIDSAEAALKNNGVTFKDDVIKQAVFADEVERLFGSEATTSLGGSSQRATAAAMARWLGGDVTTDIAEAAFKRLKRQSPDRAISTMEAFLRGGKPQSQK